MGIFNQTEEEKVVKNLIRAIRNDSRLGSEDKNYLINYINDVISGTRSNDFFEFEYLVRTITALVETKEDEYYTAESLMQKYISVVKQFLPEGIQTEDYKAVMEMVINNFYGKKGFINANLYDDKFYALFQNRYDYLYVMNLINKDYDIRQYANRIFNYAVSVSPYCANQSIFKSELLSFINGIPNEGWDFDNYSERSLQEAKKRCGIYPIDEKTLALISSEAEKAQSLIEKLNDMKQRVEEYEEKVGTLTEEGKQELINTFNTGKEDITSSINGGKKSIGDAARKGRKDIKALADSSVKDIREYIATAEKEIQEELDRYLLSLEEALKQSSDQVFSSILADAQKSIRDIKLTAQGLSRTTTSELIRIQKASEESVDKLKAYVESEPQLQELLNGAKADDAIRDALLKFGELQSGAVIATTQAVAVPGAQTSSVINSTPSIVIPGNDRLVVPANASVVIPQGGVSSTVIPAFDESIPFELRIEKILAEKERREAEGEIFHEKAEEIIRDIIEGDWCYLWGPSGCGKSYTIKQIGKLIGLDTINNGKITDKYSIMAYNDPHGRFRATQSFIAFYYGKLLLLDELDNGNVDTQVVLNDLYSELHDYLADPEEPRFVTFAEDMTVPVNPNFRMISAGNTSGEGENEAFSSRGKMDESVQQRMTPVRFWYDNRVEKIIFGEYKEWYKIFVNFRKACDAYAVHEGLTTPKGIVTTRDASDIVKYIGHNSKSVDQIISEKFVQTKSDDYLKYIMTKFKEYYQISRCPSEFEIRDRLSDVTEINIAKKLILQCNKTKENR